MEDLESSKIGCLHHPEMGDWNHPKFDGCLRRPGSSKIGCLRHPKMDDWNHPKFDECLASENG